MRNDLEHNAPPKAPAWVWGFVVLLVILSWLPLALIARSRSTTSERSPIHLFLDMDFQPKFGPQDYQPESLERGFPGEAARFPDGRAMRPAIPGTVRADAADTGTEPGDDHFYWGYEADDNLDPVMEEVEIAGNKVQQPKYFSGFPAGIKVDRDLVLRGQQRYNIYCSICHGQAGYGDGQVHQRIMRRNALTPGAAPTWVPPRNFHQQNVIDMPDGQIFDRITRGVFSVAEDGTKTYTMWPYAAQVPPRDRWAIVAYIRALQIGQYYPAGELPEDLRPQLEKASTITRPGAVAASDPITRGKQLFTEKLCATCHQVDPNVVAPTGIVFKAPVFMGKFWGTEREVHDGGPGGPIVTVTMDEDYFKQSVREPMKQIVKGTLPGMAPLPTTDEELNAIMAYVKSLSE